MRLINTLSGIVLLMFIFQTQAAAALVYSNETQVLSVEERMDIKEKIDALSPEKKAKLKKRLGKAKEKILKKIRKRTEKKGTEAFAEDAETSGVGLALIIILVGVLVAVLGFVGIADLLITVGVVILVVGLLIWLLSLL